MRFATICTLISFLATPLAIIAAPAPAPAAAALANHNLTAGDAARVTAGFGPSPTGLNSQEGLAGNNDNENDNDNSPRPRPTLLPGGTDSGNANGNENGSDTGDDDEEVVEDQGALGDDASATTTSISPEATN